MLYSILLYFRRNSLITAFWAFLGGLVIIACGSAPESAPGSVTLNKTEISLLVGDNDVITSTARGVTWSSDKTDVASVDNNGRVTAKALGKAVITASVADKSAQCIVYVSLLNMVPIKGGTFTMGSPPAETNSFQDERPLREITLTGFSMGKYQVMQKEWKVVMGDNPSNFTGDNLPVEQISWYDALIFCNKLSVLEELEPVYRIAGSTDPEDWGAIPLYPDQSRDEKWDSVEMISGASGYCLPTEAQWEYACRAGTETPFNAGENVTTSQANYDGREPYKNFPKGTYREKTIEVGSFSPNDWGLYDMHGNVWEWCWDWHANYIGGAQTNPLGADAGTYRIARGGSWSNNGRFLRSASRGSSAPSFRDIHLGLRVVRL